MELKEISPNQSILLQEAMDSFARPCKVNWQNCLSWNSPKVLQKVPFHWKYSLLSPLRSWSYLKGDCKNKKAKPHKYTLVVGDPNGDPSGLGLNLTHWRDFWANQAGSVMDISIVVMADLRWQLAFSAPASTLAPLLPRCRRHQSRRLAPSVCDLWWLSRPLESQPLERVWSLTQFY